MRARWLLLFFLPGCAYRVPEPTPRNVFAAYIDPIPGQALTSWQQPTWCVDGSNVSGCASNRNTTCASCTCSSFDGPCLDFSGVVGRWGTYEPAIRQNTVVNVLSSDPVNPATGQWIVRPRVQNAAQFSIQGTLTQVQSGTLASVVAKTHCPAQHLNVTLGSGLSVPTMIVNTSKTSSVAWLLQNTSGNAWDLTQPVRLDTKVPPSAPQQDDTWATSDNYVAYTMPTVNIRNWAIQWEDLADLPDTRPTILHVAVGQGINGGAGVDTAQTFLDLNGDAIVESAIISSTSISQRKFTHGSRAGSQLINVFGTANSARIPIFALIGAAGGQKNIDIWGGHYFVPEFGGVNLRMDVQLENAGFLSGPVNYDGVELGVIGPGVTSVANATMLPLNTTSAVWGAGGLLIQNSWVQFNSPAATKYCAANWTSFGGGIAGGNFTGNARDLTATPMVEYPGRSTNPTVLDTAISAGGFLDVNGHVEAKGTDGSILTNGTNPTTSPISGWGAANNTGFTWSFSAIALTTGTVTLSAAQMATPFLVLSGTLSGAVTLVFPNAVGYWLVDMTGVTFGANSITFKSGTATSAAVTAITATTQVYTVMSKGGNTILVNQ